MKRLLEGVKGLAMGPRGRLGAVGWIFGALLMLSANASAATTPSVACTAEQCAATASECPTAAPYLCVAGSAKNGCAGSAWNSSACTQQCDLSKCPKPTPTPVAPLAACTAEQCETTLCGGGTPYACTAGSAVGQCNKQKDYWQKHTGACSTACDATSCASVLPAVQACTQAQCEALGSTGHQCEGWGSSAKPYACASQHGEAPFGGCSGSSTYWTKIRCGGTEGCDTRVCNWNAITPHGTPPATADRTLTFKNQCSHNIRVGYVGGVVVDSSGDKMSCKQQGDCPTGSSCLTSGKGAKSCYWTLPDEFESKRNLKSKAQASITLKNPASQAAASNWVKWSGNVWAHGLCDDKFQNCKTAICPDGGCSASKGPIGPVTLAEFTLQNNDQDFYDISVINGINLPMTMAPDPVTTEQVRVFSPGGAPGAYWCGTPGDLKAAGSLKRSTWNVSELATADKKPYFRLVDPHPSNTACTVGGGQCGRLDDGAVCGLAFGAGGKAPTLLMCGTIMGWWSADEICGFNANVEGGYSFGGIDCTKTLSVPSKKGYVYADAPRQMDVLLCQRNPNAKKGVKGTFNNSCYSAKAVDGDCCGCSDWKGLKATQKCNAVNDSWTSYSLPWLKPLKAAVPTAYSYPYDDKTSTFTCYTTDTGRGGAGGVTVQKANVTNYTITFCPKSP